MIPESYWTKPIVVYLMECRELDESIILFHTEHDALL
jgi:hypothetical protein